MTRKVLSLFPLLLGLAALASCSSSRYFSIKESNPAKPSMSNYKEIHIGWMPYDENDWVQYGYENKEDWLSVTKTLNVDVMQKYLRDFIPDKKITGDTEPRSAIPETGGLYIKFKRFSSPIEDRQSWCIVDVDFIDIKSKQTIYTASAEIYTKRSAYTLEGRLWNLAYWIDNFIFYQLE